MYGSKKNQLFNLQFTESCVKSFHHIQRDKRERERERERGLPDFLDNIKFSINIIKLL